MNLLVILVKQALNVSAILTSLLILGRLAEGKEAQTEGLTLNVKLNGLFAAEKDSKGKELISSELHLPDGHLLFRHSQIGLQWNKPATYPLNATLNYMYNDKTARFAMDQGFAGVNISPNIQIDAGRMYPMMYTLLDNWPISDLLTLALKGDGKWHADGMRFNLTSLDKKWTSYIGGYQPKSYPGGVGSHPMIVGAVGYNVDYKYPLQIYVNAGYAPNVQRSIASLQTAINDKTIECLVNTACLNGHASWTMIGMTLSPKTDAFKYAINMFGMLREERGTTSFNQSDLIGMYGKYTGKMAGYVLEAKMKAVKYPVQLTLRYDNVQLSHRFDELSQAQLNDTLEIPNRPHAISLKTTYLGPHGLQPFIAIRYDRGEAIPLTGISLGLIWNWSKKLYDYNETTTTSIQ